MKTLTAEDYFLQKFGNKLTASDSWVIRFAEEYAQLKVDSASQDKPKGLNAEVILNDECSDNLWNILEEKDTPEELRSYKRFILDAMNRFSSQDKWISEKELTENFFDYLKIAKHDFVNSVNKQMWDNELRTACESFVIAFDQAVSKLPSPPKAEK